MDNSINDGVQVWRDYVSEIVGFLAGIEQARHLTIPYGDLLERPQETASAIGRLLGLQDCEPLKAYLLAQRKRPTPFSDPVTDLTAPYHVRPMRRADRQTLALAGDTARRLGYALSSV